MSGRVMVALAVVLVGAISLTGLLWAMQRRLIYLPHGQVPAVTEVLPGAREVTLHTSDGLELGAWWVPAAPPGTGRQPRGAVIVFNGNAGNRAHRAPLAAALAEGGWSVLLFDYRGYGGNPGRPSEDGLLRDATAARRWVVSQPEAENGRIAYFGESLGSAVAVALAGDEPPLALVLRSPFPSLATVGELHYPFLPVRRLLRDRYPVAEQLAGLDVPLLVIAGARDRIVPPALSRAVFTGAAGEPKRFVSIPGAGHNDLALLAGDELVSETLAFLAAAGAGMGQDGR